MGLEVNCCPEHRDVLTRPRLKSVNTSRIVLGVLALTIAWMGFQLGTHRHTGILRTLAGIRQFLSHASDSSDTQPMKRSVSPGPQHSVHLSWKASTSAVAGYNVYRRGPSGPTKINSEPVTGTIYVDSSVQPGQTYYYLTKAVSSTGTESRPSNEVEAVVPSP
jgi:hypothetical protein